MRHILIIIFCGLLIGCDGIGKTIKETLYTPVGARAGGKGEISKIAIQSYLAERQLARPQIVKDVTAKLRAGDKYRKRIKDQHNRWCLTTVWLDRKNEDILHIATKRSETCEKCKGTGARDWSKHKTIKKQMDKAPFETRCLGCDGKGELPGLFVERKFILAPEDYENPKEAQKVMLANAYEGAPVGTEEKVKQLASNDPKKRLEACVWLHENFVKKGMFLRKLDPMLEKARWQETKKNIMVFQFWAGKGIKSERKRAYYRIYIKKDSGKVKKAGFYPSF